MGLYIYHKKASLKNKKNTKAIRLNNVIERGIDLDFFSSFIQPITFKVPVNSILIINDINLWKQGKTQLNHSGKIFYKSDTKAIEKYIKKRKFHLLQKDIIEDTEDRTLYSFYKNEVEKGMYIESVFDSSFKDGCTEFYQKYESSKIHTNFDAFRLACKLEYEDWRFDDKEDFLETIEYYKKNLIDNFEFGKSMLNYC